MIREIGRFVRDMSMFATFILVSLIREGWFAVADRFRRRP